MHDPNTDGKESVGMLPKPQLSWIKLLSIAYMYTCGGAYGIEQAVQIAGSFVTNSSLIIAGIVWALPQALITAELSTTFPRMGSAVYWVEYGLGRRWGTVNAIISLIGQIFDLALYPGLLVSYASTLVPVLNEWGPAFGLQVACLIVIAIANIIGVELLGTAAQISNFITVAPFVLLPFAALGNHLSFDFSYDGPILNTQPLSNWYVFVSTILWTFQGWSSVGSLASEVKDVKRSYPLAVYICVTLVVITYIYPIFFGIALQPDLTQWNEGYFPTLMGNVANWLGVWVLIGATVANFSSGLAATGLYSRYLQAICKENFLPIPFLSRTDTTRFNTPVPAIIVISLINLGLMNLSFDNLVVVDSFFNLIGIILVAVSFLRLRYTHKEIPRPFQIPGGINVAWIITISTICIGIVAAYVVSLGAWEQVVGVFGTVIVVYIVAVWREYRNSSSSSSNSNRTTNPTATENGEYSNPLIDTDENTDNTIFRVNQLRLDKDNIEYRTPLLIN